MADKERDLIDREKLYKLIDNFDVLSVPTDGFRHCLADYLIANGVTVQGWISVEDRLPQEYGAVCKNVNVLMDDGLVTVGWLNQVTGKGYYLDTNNDFICTAPLTEFTHWMPLPQPPKEG